MPKLLLAGIFKPFGVANEYGEALNTMELLNNQVTREQGMHSPRSNNPSFGLYLMAENIEVETTVLDFPQWKDFTREIKSGNYTHVGISFIVPNILKVQRMVEFIRKHKPETKVILGGHGAGIPGLKELVDYDDICYGEGIVWMRKYFGEDLNKPIIHPIVYTAVGQYIYGAPILDKAGIILPGVGCQNSCRFCATTHKFDKQYTPFLKSGKEVFDACEKSEKGLDVSDFALMDENFLKSSTRARELLAEMEANKKAFTFSTFSSAEAITKVGVDFLVRTGINFIWIGVESKANVFEKTHGIDVGALIKDLQVHGITVLASAILFMEHHDKETIQEDIDWAVGLESDLLQFMHFGPIPGTALYKDYEEQGILMKDVPWHEQHGQDKIWFRHPHFTNEETHTVLKNAFKQKFATHGPSVVGLMHTAVSGYLRAVKDIKEREEKGLVWNSRAYKYEKHPNPKPDEFMRLRIEELADNALRFRPLLRTSLKYAPHKYAADKVRKVMGLYEEAFGGLTLQQKFFSTVVATTAILENYRSKRGVVMRQPPVNRVTYADRSKQVQEESSGFGVDTDLSSISQKIVPEVAASSSE